MDYPPDLMKIGDEVRACVHFDLITGVVVFNSWKGYYVIRGDSTLFGKGDYRVGKASCHLVDSDLQKQRKKDADDRYARSMA